MVKEVHGHALEAGLESDLRVGSALIHMYVSAVWMMHEWFLRGWRIVM